MLILDVKKYFMHSDYDMLWVKEVRVKKNPKDAEMYAAFCKPQNGELILEIGSGEGRIAYFIIEKKATYVGIDISRKMLFLANQKLSKKLKKKKHYHLILADGEHLPFKENIFDKAFCFATSWFLPHQDLLISEVCRVTKFNGYFFCSFRNLLNSNIANRLKIRNLFNKLQRIVKYLKLKAIVKYSLLAFFIANQQKYGMDKDWLESFLEYGVTPFFPLSPSQILRFYSQSGFRIEKISSNLQKSILDEEEDVNEETLKHKKMAQYPTLIVTARAVKAPLREIKLKC